MRLALGATGGSVVRTVLLRSLKMVLTGIVFGLCVSVASARVLESMLFGVTRNDPLTLALGTTVVLVAATAVSIIPAERAARVDPAASLQLE